MQINTRYEDFVIFCNNLYSDLKGQDEAGVLIRLVTCLEVLLTFVMSITSKESCNEYLVESQY